MKLFFFQAQCECLEEMTHLLRKELGEKEIEMDLLKEEIDLYKNQVRLLTDRLRLVASHFLLLSTCMSFL